METAADDTVECVVRKMKTNFFIKNALAYRVSYSRLIEPGHEALQ